jgi:GGDEF domain-containing protein
MSFQADILEATLHQMDEAIVIVDCCSNVLFWNQAASSLTGYDSSDVLAHPCPNLIATQSISNDSPSGKPSSVALKHKCGHIIPAMLRIFNLQSATREAAGKAMLFYPIEQLEPANSDESSGPADLKRSHAEMSDRIEAAHHQWRTSGIPFGLLRIVVDQAESLRITHGGEACESMMRTVQQTLNRQLKPAEIIARWDTAEFLLLSHERTSEQIDEHALHLAGMARTADFRWWGDRVNLTVSIGAAFAAEGHTLNSLLGAALGAMHSATYAGGNQVIHARGI